MCKKKSFPTAREKHKPPHHLDYVPKQDGILKPDLAAYKEEIDGIKAFFEKIDGVGGRMPQELKDRLATLEQAL